MFEQEVTHAHPLVCPGAGKSRELDEKAKNVSTLAKLPQLIGDATNSVFRSSQIFFRNVTIVSR